MKKSDHAWSKLSDYQKVIGNKTQFVAGYETALKDMIPDAERLLEIAENADTSARMNLRLRKWKRPSKFTMCQCDLLWSELRDLLRIARGK